MHGVQAEFCVYEIGLQVNRFVRTYDRCQNVRQDVKLDELPDVRLLVRLQIRSILGV